MFDSGVELKHWYSVTWTAQPGDGAVSVKVRAANNDYDLGKSLYTTAPFQYGTVVGRYLQVRVQLDARCRKTPTWVWPTMQSLTINEEPGHCPPGMIDGEHSQPKNCTVDARFPHVQHNPTMKLGIGNPTSPYPETDTIRIQLGTPGSPVCGADKPECWTLCETGGVSQNSITGQVHLGGGVYEIQLQKPITEGRATTIRYIHDYASDAITYFAHPANVNGDSISAPIDIIWLIDYLNGISDLPWKPYSCDINHSNQCTPLDITGVIDLLNGNGFTSWSNVSKPSTSPCMDSGCSGMGLMAGGDEEFEHAFDESNEPLVSAMIEFLTHAQVTETTTIDDIVQAASSLIEWANEFFSAEEREILAKTLIDSTMGFSDPAVQNEISGLIDQLQK